MTLTAEQRIARKKYLGASDIPAVLGLDLFRNSRDVYESKVRDLQEDEPTPAMKFGNWMEPLLLDFAADYVGKPLSGRGVMLIDEATGVLACNLDGWFNDREIIEAKTTGFPDEYGDAGTDEVPGRVLAQTHHSMYVKGAVLAWVPVFFRAYVAEPRMYRVERNDELVEVVVERGMKFWNEHVIPRIPPEGVTPSLEIAKRIQRVPNVITDVPDALVEAWGQAKADANAGEKRKKSAEAALRAAIGEAEAGRFSGGLIVRQVVKRAGYTVNATEYEQLKLKGETAVRAALGRAITTGERELLKSKGEDQ